MVTTPKPKSERPMPRILRVSRTCRITPHMIRVTFAGPALRGFPAGREGGNCKLLVPEPDQTLGSFQAQLAAGEKMTTRTYTVRAFREAALELDIDFVSHADQGPASIWAERAKEGSFCGFRGPSLPKVTEFYADWYLLAADMSALPVAAATLEAMPRDAQGVAVFEVLSEADKQDLNTPKGFIVHWLIQPDARRVSMQQVQFIKAMPWPSGRVQTCIAGESSTIRALRDFVFNEKRLLKEDVYISGYWKLGLVEDEHQKMKRAAA
ncbi:MAG: siderophore-interacting protein [Pseudomonadota bacterium]